MKSPGCASTSAIRPWRPRQARSSGTVDEVLRRKVIGDEEAITLRPGDVLPPGLPEARALAGDLARQEEDVLSVAILPQVALPFLEKREPRKRGEPG